MEVILLKNKLEFTQMYREMYRVVCNIYVIYKNLCFEYRANVFLFFFNLIVYVFLKEIKI